MHVSIESGTSRHEQANDKTRSWKAYKNEAPLLKNCRVGIYLAVSVNLRFLHGNLTGAKNKHGL